MIDRNLMKQVVPLSAQDHQSRRLHRHPDDLVRCARAINATFVSLFEFGDACREFPIVFVPAGTAEDGKKEIAPMAVMGLHQGENLMIDAAGTWLARYAPVTLRTHPFAMAPYEGDHLLLCIDDAYDGWSDTEGAPLFEANGEPTTFVTEMRDLLQRFETDVQTTRMFCRRITDLDLLRPMRFDATLPDGQTITADGFLALDDEKFAALPDATLGELHRSGALGLLHLHQASLGNMRHLAERRMAQRAAA